MKKVKIEHVAMYVNNLETAKNFFVKYLGGRFNDGYHNKTTEMTALLKKEGYVVASGPRITGDGYYESCIIAFEGNQIEITE